MPKCHCGNNKFYCTQIATRTVLCNAQGDIVDEADCEDPFLTGDWEIDGPYECAKCHRRVLLCGDRC